MLHCRPFVSPIPPEANHMATATARKMSKSAFLTGFLKKIPQANPDVVNESWAKAGYAGSVSRSLVGKLRTDLGLSGNIRAIPERPWHPRANSHRSRTSRRRGTAMDSNPRITVVLSDELLCHLSKVAQE